MRPPSHCLYGISFGEVFTLCNWQLPPCGGCCDLLSVVLQCDDQDLHTPANASSCQRLLCNRQLTCLFLTRLLFKRHESCGVPCCTSTACELGNLRDYRRGWDFHRSPTMSGDGKFFTTTKKGALRSSTITGSFRGRRVLKAQHRILLSLCQTWMLVRPLQPWVAHSSILLQGVSQLLVLHHASSKRHLMPPQQVR